MSVCHSFMLTVTCLGTFALSAAANDLPYTQHENVVYGEAHGVGLLLDVFVPTGDRNGHAIIDVISGAWYSDRGKIRDHAARRHSTSCASRAIPYSRSAPDLKPNSPCPRCSHT